MGVGISYSREGIPIHLPMDKETYSLASVFLERAEWTSFANVVHLKAWVEHTWPLNIYPNLLWPGEAGRGEPNTTLFHLTALLMKALDRSKHQINRVRKLFRDYWLHLSGVFFQPCSVFCVVEEQKLKEDVRRKEAGKERRRGDKPWGYLWNLLDRSHFPVMESESQPTSKWYPPWSLGDRTFIFLCLCSPLLRHTVTHPTLSLSFSLLLYVFCDTVSPFKLPVSVCEHFVAIQVHYHGYQYFISKYISRTDSSFRYHSLWLLDASECFVRAQRRDRVDKIGDFITIPL